MQVNHGVNEVLVLNIAFVKKYLLNVYVLKIFLSKSGSLRRTLFFIVISILLFGCGGGSSSVSKPQPVSTATSSPSPSPFPSPSPSSSPTANPEPTLEPTATPSPQREFSRVFTRLLDADGLENTNANALIYAAFGDSTIESPGLYSNDHFDVDHITQSHDAQVGPHFVFSIHRDLDGDRGVFVDRQRNEIKIFDGSDNETKGFEGDIFEYAWKFKLNSLIEVSSRFSHFFQLKAKYGDDSSPIVTLTGSKRSGNDTLQVRHVARSSGSVTYLDQIDLDEVRGEWLEVLCRTQYSEADSGGFLQLSVVRMRDALKILSVDVSNLDMWRGPVESGEEGRIPFVRPKWGIYRSLIELDNLRADEETVNFANFRISEVIEIVE